MLIYRPYTSPCNDSYTSSYLPTLIRVPIVTNNDILRRLRYTYDLNDSEMVRLAKYENHKVTRQQISSWLKKEEHPDYLRCSDWEMAVFLNNFITLQRGKKEGPTPPPERQLNNNIILRKLKIALKLSAEDMIDILAYANLDISKHELSAFFRKVGHKNYRECQDQVLRNFLLGLQKKKNAPPSPWEKSKKTK